MQVFTWHDEGQNLMAVQQESCQNIANGVELAAAAQNRAVVELPYTGMFHFTSAVADQCFAGVLVSVEVTGKSFSP